MLRFQHLRANCFAGEMTRGRVFGSRTSPTGYQRHVKITCMKKPSALANWTPEEIALGKKWVEIWKLAAVDLERIKRKETRELDNY